MASEQMPSDGDRRTRLHAAESTDKGDLAIVLTGGGARAAYQVGVLRAIARRYPDLQPQIVTGVSAGAINAVYLCSREAGFERIVEELEQHWSRLEIDHVIRSDSPSMGANALRWGAKLISGGSPLWPDARGMVDTSPLEEFLTRILSPEGDEISGLTENLSRGAMKALAVTTLNYTTGQTVTWVMGRGIEMWDRPNRRSIYARITIPHIMASSALPFVFPAINLAEAWHGDGGVRLVAPLSPALHLGAKRIIAMTTRYQQTFEEADQPDSSGYPPPVQIAGHLMSAIFLDVIDQDAIRLERLNSVLRKLPEEEREGMNVIDLLVIRPSVDLGLLAGQYEPKIPPSLRFFLRGLGSKETSRSDFLSMLMFQPDYVRRLLEIGEADGEARMDEIAAILGETPEKKEAS